MIKLVNLLLEVQGKPKALILAGAPGAGKGYILRGLDLGGLKTLNIDDTFIDLLKQSNVSLDLKSHGPEDRSTSAKAMAAASKKHKNELIPNLIANKESFILDGTAASQRNTIKLKSELESAGYDVFMLYVYTDLERSLKQNQDRFERSGGKDRSLQPAIVMSTWNSVTKNFEPYQQTFGKNFVSVANTGEAMTDLEQIITKYLDPYKPQNTKPKTDKEKIRSRAKKEQINQEIQDLLNSDHLQNIIKYSVSKDEAQTQISNFLNI
jgi:adenylate kinase family enzyme